MLSVHALPSNTEKVMHVSLSSDSADFILIDFRLLDYLWQSLYHLDITNCFIDVSKFSTTQSLQPLIRKQSFNNVGPPFNSYPFRCDLVSPPIQFFIEFYMLAQFLTIRLSLTLCWLENRTMKKIWLEVQLRKILTLNWISLIWHRHDHSFFNNTSLLKNISVWLGCQTTDGLLHLESWPVVHTLYIPVHTGMDHAIVWYRYKRT